MREERKVIQEYQYFVSDIWNMILANRIDEANEYIDAFDFTRFADLTEPEIEKQKREYHKAIRKSYIEGEGYRFFKFITIVCYSNRHIVRKLIKQGRINKTIYYKGE